MRIIANEGGVASGRIFNVGNPGNVYSMRELAEMMLTMAADYPEYAEFAQRTKIVETSSGHFYGEGYQDVQNRQPRITDTMQALNWAPQVDMRTALRRIFDSYRHQVGRARELLEPSN
jgi:nucleoside-diphosphate-sugar epimerase